MNSYVNKAQENKNQKSLNVAQKKSNNIVTSEFSNQHPKTVAQMQLQEIANNSEQIKQATQLQKMVNTNSSLPIQKKGEEEEELQMKAIPIQKKGVEEEEELQMKAIPIQKKGIEEEEPLQGKFVLPIQKKENNTGLPDNLKSGIENLSGYAMDDVKVHYNSDKPAELQAHAYAQGTDIHIASGQEKHLPHEAWHVVQQKQGRVQPTLQMKGNVNINDDAGLETEADVMGAKALQASAFQTPLQAKAKISGPAVQLVLDESKRPAHDQRMEDLKEKTIAILKDMRVGVNWETKYAKKGQEKGSTFLSSEKTEYEAEIRHAALKKYWASLTPKEKLEMIGEGAKVGLQGLGLAGKGGEKLASLALERRGKKEKEEPVEEKKPEETSSSSWLNELTSDDMQTMYNVYSEIGELQKKYKETKAKVGKKMGEAGESVGSAVGALRNEANFNKRMESLRQEFMVLRTKYDLLNKAIKDNDDMSRFEVELEALYRGLMYTVKGPAMVYNGGELNNEGRKMHTKLCLRSIIEITEASRNREYLGVEEMVKKGISSAKKLGSDLLEKIWKSDEKPSEELIAAAKGSLALELNSVLNKSWSAHTRWVSTPSGVKAIKTAMLSKGTDDDKFEKVKALARAAYNTKSSNRSPETQIFYEALAKLNKNDVDSLKLTQSIIVSVGTRLA